MESCIFYVYIYVFCFYIIFIYLFIYFLHTVIRRPVLQSITNLYTALGFQEFIFNINILHALVWFEITISF